MYIHTYTYIYTHMYMHIYIFVCIFMYQYKYSYISYVNVYYPPLAPPLSCVPTPRSPTVATVGRLVLPRALSAACHMLWCV